MTNPIIRIHDIETNEVIDREMTSEEFKQYKENIATSKAISDEETLKENAKTSAFAKLAALGLTPEEINAIS